MKARAPRHTKWAARNVTNKAIAVLLASALPAVFSVATLEPRVKPAPIAANLSSGAHDFAVPQKQPLDRSDHLHHHQHHQSQPSSSNQDGRSQPIDRDKQAFVAELLRMLHEQYAASRSSKSDDKRQKSDSLEERRSHLPAAGQQQRLDSGPRMMHQLLEAIGADGDMRRLVDWVQSSLNPAAIPELSTQFVVSKLGSVNCPALLQPDDESTLIPRFLLFNEHFVDVPFELSINPNANECLVNGKLDPRRKTVVLVHGFLTGYTLVDGLTNIKNLLLDLNRSIGELAISAFKNNTYSHLINGSSFVYTEDLSAKISERMYNVIIVDWFSGANPSPRANYIRAATNAQVVGRLIARFLSALVVQCGTPASHIEIIAHSLGKC
jgi:hypothetical protein